MYILIIISYSRLIIITTTQADNVKRCRMNQTVCALGLSTVYIIRGEFSRPQKIVHLPFQVSMLLVILICFDCPLRSENATYMTIFCFATLYFLFRKFVLCLVHPNENCPKYVLWGLGVCHLTSLVYILDWNEDWQEWPIPSFLGLTSGIVCGYILDYVACFRSN